MRLFKKVSAGAIGQATNSLAAGGKGHTTWMKKKKKPAAHVPDCAPPAPMPLTDYNNKLPLRRTTCSENSTTPKKIHVALSFPFLW